MLKRLKKLGVRITVDSEGAGRLPARKACDHVQGFFFGKPFRADDVSEMLRAEDLVLAGVSHTE